MSDAPQYDNPAADPDAPASPYSQPPTQHPGNPYGEGDGYQPSPYASPEPASPYAPPAPYAPPSQPGPAASPYGEGGAYQQSPYAAPQPAAPPQEGAPAANPYGPPSAAPSPYSDGYVPPTPAYDPRYATPPAADPAAYPAPAPVSPERQVAYSPTGHPMEPPRQVNVAPIAPYISQAQPGEQRLAPEGFQPRPSLPGAAVGPSGSAYAAPPRAASSGDFVTAALAGLGIAVGSVVIWCVLAYTTGYSIGYLAIFTGLLIGRTMMKLRGGPDETTALTAVGLTALSILVGAFMAAVFAVMKVSGAPFGDSLSLGVDDPVGAIMPSNPLMFLAYGIALLVAYRSATGKTKRRF